MEKGWNTLPVEFTPDYLEDIREMENMNVYDFIPMLGLYLPDGWKRIYLYSIDDHPKGIFMGDAEGYGAYLVDVSGKGLFDENAIIAKEFFDRVKCYYGYAIIDEGLYQVKVGAFKKI